MMDPHAFDLFTREIIRSIIKSIPGVRELLDPDTLAALEGPLYTSSIKAAGDISSINSVYHDAVTGALVEYFEGGSVVSSRNEFKQATITAFSDAFDSGWLDGGAELPISDEALSWIESRLNEEFIYIEELFDQMKELRRDKEFDYFAWVSTRADGYTRTLREIYNEARLMVTSNIMVTFTGSSGRESCADCKRLHGQRHKLQWFIDRDVVPPFGGGLECSPGRHCEHYLETDKGEQVTI